ncbi:metallophosphoesterase [Neobacillus piezotolerans]|uniref:Metallophosphoesterase n=1 Tax=Neobacillus piezotolerans TaxID=2259171 RepID=A0A3D8GW62_9BACI|nr:metallophosphoesterase [Neobacillus piezotolerans]RDU38401.1 metallophosphoesterase [Neobacillus piezotolerans]
MAKKQSRRTFLKTLLGGTLAVFGLGSGGYFYAREIEPILLDIQTHVIAHSLIPAQLDGIRIILFSDTHIGFQYTLERLNTLARKINNQRPDIIIFSGDLMDEPNKYESAQAIVPILKGLDAPLGKYAIYGNHDHGGYGTKLYKTLMDASGFTTLVNENVAVTRNGQSIYLAGIDDAMLGKPDIESSVKNIPQGAYKILLSHAPDLADDASRFGFHLQLSGHSHGGQIKIPFFGALVKPPFAEKYHEGFYTIAGDDPLTLYVNRGLGTTRLPFRFMSKPELTVFTLKKSSE